MTDPPPRRRRFLVSAEPGRLFRSSIPPRACPPPQLVLLGVISVTATGFMEWATDLPIPNDIVFVLIVGGVTSHGGAAAGVAASLLAGLARLISSGVPATRKRFPGRSPRSTVSRCSPSFSALYCSPMPSTGPSAPCSYRPYTIR